MIDNNDLVIDARLHLHDLGREFGDFGKVVSLSGEGVTDLLDLVSEETTVLESHDVD
jgi:hypothetical protein